ncbi:MAG: hypothetical protein MUE73_08625, partial [Planctomycetes bacterium]|nr:hypothetical protein [Planctomycetota bacterium]
MIRIVLAVTLALAATGSLPAAALADEEPSPPAAAEDSKPAAEPSTAEPSTAGERAQIHMKNGMILTGVVKGRGFEVLRGSHFSPAESPEEEGAGIRLWYALGLNGFFFVRQDSVAEIRFLGALNEQEVARIAADLEDAKARGEQDRARAVAELAAKKAAAKEAAGDEAESPPAETGEEAPRRLDAERLQKIRDLLKLYPPTDWKPSRLEEIKRRIVILDIFPSDEERGFIDNYDVWLEGYRLWRESQGLSADESGTPEAPKVPAPEAP